MIGTYRGVKISGALAALLQSLILMGCSSGSLVTGETPQVNSGMTNKSGAADNEGDEADLPGEISGAFLTCSFVATGESGFPQTDDYQSVGCGLRDNGREKVDLSRFETSLTQLDASQNELPTQSKLAPAGSTWHLFTQIRIDTPRDHRLAFTVRQARTDQNIKTYQFGIMDLYEASLSSDTVLELVGNMPIGGTFTLLSGPGSNSVGDYAVFPIAFCDNGVIRDRVDTSCQSKFGQSITNISSTFGITNSRIEKKSKTTKTAAVCLKQINEAKCGTLLGLESAGLKPVLEGGGCFMINSQDSILIYSRSQIETYHLNARLLEQYVKAKTCGS